MTPDYSNSSVLQRTRDIAQEIIRKRAVLREVEKRLGTPVEKCGDFEQARHLAHALVSLAQEATLANYLLERGSADSGSPFGETKNSRPPDFDLEGAIHWVGRTV
jgi:hypothetical protein